MNAIHEILLANPLLRTGLDIISVTIPLAALLAFAGMGFISGTARVLSLTRRRSSYDKCARQLALLGLILGWLLLIGGRVWIFFTQAGCTPDSLPSFLVEMGWILLSLAVLISSLYYMLWKALGNMPVLHVTLGMLSGVQGCVAVVATLAAARFLAAFARPDAAAMTFADIFPAAWSAPLWSALCYTLPLILAMPAAFGALWLPLRRKRDDFGRDHYNAMIPWCAGWARNAWCLLWLLLLVSSGLRIWLHWQGGVFSARDAIVESSRLLLWLVPVPLWSMVRRSAIALRHKLTLLAALLIAVGFMLPYYLEATSM
ncbi:hypothetical protein [uncultured Desulfovibrio sp.]|uniref:hypothetical protein n=1 Tax=uncultured Desulfovibrio sp. TaxID=167968 RepID=UPI0003A9F312|nr:hypothetical protein [uncultured Desulfovibrio sp.]